jgi:carbonic anhydrase
VKAAIDGAEVGNITAMLENIQPAIAALEDYPGEKTSANKDYVNLVTRKNIELTVLNIRAGSPVIAELEVRGDVAIVGALYDMNSGAVEFLPVPHAM